MNVILIFNGLGNQMSQYAFYLAKKNIDSNTIYMYYPAKNDNKHNGYELESVFDIELNKNIKYYYLHFVYSLYWNKDTAGLLGRMCRKILKAIKINVVYEKSYDYNSSFLLESQFNNAYYWGGWHNERYFLDIKEEIKRQFKFDDAKIDSETLLLKNEICKNNSISIHIRRGDYLNKNTVATYGGICNLEYYKKAIDYMSQNIDNPHFYIFSDDKKWVNENFDIPNSIIVSNNCNKNSWKDMYLMSQCKHNINANSTFSWWAAWLNSNENKIIIVPKRFNNTDTSDIYPKNWLKL